MRAGRDERTVATGRGISTFTVLFAGEMDLRALLVSTAVAAAVASGCSVVVEEADRDGAANGTGEAPAQPGELGLAEDAPSGPLDADTVAVLERNTYLDGRPNNGDLTALGATHDVRMAWPLVDILRFEGEGERKDAAVGALTELTGATPPDDATAWVFFQDLLLAEDVPAPPDYLRYKRGVHRAFDPRWTPFFIAPAHIDWREVSWGGVPRDGIPALVDPAVETVAESGWLSDGDVIFVVAVGDESRAYPKRVMDVHELANDTVGGRRIALPYCTLCGSAIAYLTEGVAGADQPLEFHTSGLLLRSNKLMYDRQTESLWNQFTGVGVTGPMRGVELEPVGIVTTTWGEWAPANPNATVLAKPRDVPRGLGDPYDGTLLDDRDQSRPIFPVGDVDDRLDAMTLVLGVTVDGGAIAFPVEAARSALEVGEAVEAAGVRVELGDGGELMAATTGGTEIAFHEAFWFAWSQFHPDTDVWQP